MAEVRLENITKDFGKVRALEGLSFSLEDGEFFVLLGPTGAGKTTTLRTVAGLEKPAAGRVLLGGEDATGWSPAQRDVAFVFQQYSLYPHLTVFENLAFPLKAPGKKLGAGEIRQRVGQVAAKLGIESKLDNKATALSGGEMQRVSLGRALVREPACFLMDEPLSSLDAKLREGLRVELKHLQVELGATILYVTHDQVEAMTLADRVGVLVGGHLQQVGPPETVYEYPDNIEVAQQMGHLPLNLFPVGEEAVRAAGIDRIGVRAEHLRVVPGEQASPDDLRARVLRVERLGAEEVAFLQAGEERLHAMAEKHGLFPNAGEVAVRVESAHAFGFDAEGRRIALPGNGMAGTPPGGESPAATARRLNRSLQA
jgi:multiple sugar transport system ATP-binding protein